MLAGEEFTQIRPLSCFCSFPPFVRNMVPSLPSLPSPSDVQVRIKCRDYVGQIAIYRDRLAVRLPDKVSGNKEQMCELMLL